MSRGGTDLRPNHRPHVVTLGHHPPVRWIGQLRWHLQQRRRVTTQRGEQLWRAGNPSAAHLLRYRRVELVRDRRPMLRRVDSLPDKWPEPPRRCHRLRPLLPRLLRRHGHLPHWLRSGARRGGVKPSPGRAQGEVLALDGRGRADGPGGRPHQTPGVAHLSPPHAGLLTWRPPAELVCLDVSLFC